MIILLAFVSLVQAQDDSGIVLMVAPMEQSGNIPQSVDDRLQSKLMAATNAAGIVAEKDFGQFFVSGKFAHSYTETLPGPPIQTVIHTTLMLYIGDVKNKEVYASETFDLRGVGRSEERALHNAINQIKGNNRTFISFIERGKEKIIAYFDKNYSHYLDSAKFANAQGEKAKALYYATLIPAGCKGHAEAQKMVDQICKKYNTPTTTAKSTGRQWNRQQQHPRSVIDFIPYK
jgi:hypothetical protein